jgi:hypothetical protein
MTILIVFLAGAACGAWAGWKWGFNAAIYWYRDQTIEGARAKAERDRV